jgi:hypothetical protein
LILRRRLQYLLCLLYLLEPMVDLILPIPRHLGHLLRLCPELLLIHRHRPHK